VIAVVGGLVSLGIGFDRAAANPVCGAKTCGLLMKFPNMVVIKKSRVDIKQEYRNKA
jgi:hypothetical protein